LFPQLLMGLMATHGKYRSLSALSTQLFWLITYPMYL
jgi:hypothetical protein